jgi:hypothetical protein
MKKWKGERGKWKVKEKGKKRRDRGVEKGRENRHGQTKNKRTILYITFVHWNIYSTLCDWNSHVICTFSHLDIH